MTSRVRTEFFKGLAAVSVLFLSLPGACKKAPAPDAAPPAAPSSRQAAPPFSLKDLQGNSVSLSQFKGKPVFVEFWATWCGPCQMSMPMVEKLQADYAGKVQVLGMNLDDDVAAVPGFVKSMGVRYPTLLAAGSGVDAAYQVSGIPAFFLIDAEGRLVDGWLGFDPSFEQAWRRSLDALLAQ